MFEDWDHSLCFLLQEGINTHPTVCQQTHYNKKNTQTNTHRKSIMEIEQYFELNINEEITKFIVHSQNLT